MSIEDINISKLADLDKLRSAPKLNRHQTKILIKEVRHLLDQADWVTIGVMSPSLETGVNAVRKIEQRFEYKKMICVKLPTTNGPVFLKANQKTGEIHARIEYGLGEGILISCQKNDNSVITKTIGPFPLDFFD